MASDDQSLSEWLENRIPELSNDSSPLAQEFIKTGSAYLKLTERFNKVMGIADKYLEKLKSSSEELAESKQEVQRKNDELTALSITLQKNEEKYRLLAENSTDVIWTMDFEGSFTYVSPSVFQLRGYSPEEVMHQTINEAVCPGSIQTVEQHMKEALNSLNKGVPGKSSTTDIEQPCRDGKTVWTEVITRLIFNDAGEPIGFLGISRDITQRRLIQQALIENEKKFVAIFAFTPDPIIILNNDLRIIEVNQGFEQVFGFFARSVEGRDLLKSGIIHPDDIPKMFEETDSLLAVRRRELTFIAKTAMPFVAEVAISRILIQTEPCILIQIHDIDEIRRAHDAVAQVNNKLKILSSITRHDILNRIMVTLAYSGFLQEELTEPEQKKKLNAITQSSQEIQNLINFTGHYQELGETAPSWHYIDSILQETLIMKMLSRVEFKSGLKGVEIYADNMLEKVVYNLVENSIRHGKNLTSIRFSRYEENGVLTIVYEDDGGGIDEKEKKKVFQKGFGKNTGLGLFLIREILSITSIKITETGEPGVGVRFEIHVPAGKWRMEKE